MAQQRVLTDQSIEPRGRDLRCLLMGKESCLREESKHVSCTHPCILTARSWQMPVWVLSTLVFGGVLLLALVCWLLYFKFFLASDDAGLEPGTSAAAPSVGEQEAVAPVASTEGAASLPDSAKPHGNFADAAARAAVAAAAKAQAAAHRFFDMFGGRKVATPLDEPAGGTAAPVAQSTSAEQGGAPAEVAEQAGAPAEVAGEQTPAEASGGDSGAA